MTNPQFRQNWADADTRDVTDYSPSKSTGLLNRDELPRPSRSSTSWYHAAPTTSATSATVAQNLDPLLGSQIPGGDHKLSQTMTNEALRTALNSSQGKQNRGETDAPGLTTRAPSVVMEMAESPPAQSVSQGIPPEIRSFTAEIIFVTVCSVGMMFFSFLMLDVLVCQQHLRVALGLASSELPWLVGAFNTANGLSVVISGSLTDLLPPKTLMLGAFAWLTIWNIIGVFSLDSSRYVLFFIVRAMQGLAVGVLVTGSLSILGRVYKPGLRKNRAFSAMAATAPFGSALGALQGGALSSHLRWIFGTNALISGLCCLAAFFSIPSLRPVADKNGSEVPSLRQFDYIGATFAVLGCVFLLFGLTQGSVTNWSPYTYALIIVGGLHLIGLFFVERRVRRPLIPSRLWKTKGFTPLMIAYFLGFGSYLGAWQFFIIQFFLRIQQTSPIIVACFLIPNAIVGVLATWVVSRTLHLVPGHYIYVAAMFAFTMGSVFFLPQTPNTIYWALSFPGIILVTFGPDLSFAAASIFITSNVARSYQGSAASLLVTNQNLSSAIITSVADAIGKKVDVSPEGEIGLHGLRSIWWFALAAQLVAAAITVIYVRIPKEEEKEHVT